jgi:hypothetical protein
LNALALKKANNFVCLIAAAILCLVTGVSLSQSKGMIKTMMESKSETVKLPEPVHDSDVSVEKALLKRRSVRSFRDSPLKLAELSQLPWAAQATSLNLGTVVIGAFHDDAVKKVLKMSESEQPLYIMPVEKLK